MAPVRSHSRSLPLAAALAALVLGAMLAQTLRIEPRLGGSLQEASRWRLGVGWDLHIDAPGPSWTW